MRMRVPRFALRSGDILLDQHMGGGELARVTGGSAARGKGYWVTFVTPLNPRGRSAYPNGQTSGNRTDIVEIERP